MTNQINTFNPLIPLWRVLGFQMDTANCLVVYTVSAKTELKALHIAEKYDPAVNQMDVDVLRLE